MFQTKIKTQTYLWGCVLFVLGWLLLAGSGCTREEVVLVLKQQAANTYVFDDLAGNVRITIYNTPNSYDITVVNGPGSVIGCAIRNHADPGTIYFSDAYIKKGGAETQSSSTKGLPVGGKMELKLVLYKSTVSSAIYQAIEALGLDFWDGIKKYKENIAEEYYSVFVLE